jgi:hypothetical protein
MFSSVWDFLKDGTNQAVLSWIGGGIAAVAAGIWAVVRFMAKDGDNKPSKPSVRLHQRGAPRSSPGPSITADRGSVAVGHDINAPVNIRLPGEAISTGVQSSTFSAGRSITINIFLVGGGEFSKNDLAQFVTQTVQGIGKDE